MSPTYQVVCRLPLPAAPLAEQRESRAPPITLPARFPSLTDAVRHFLKLAKDGFRGLLIVEGDRVIIDLREWSPPFFVERRATLWDEIDAIEHGRVPTHDPVAAIAERACRIAELNVFLALA